MLVLTRKNGQSIRIGDNIEIKVISAGPGRVRIGIVAPNHVPVQRSELVETGFRTEFGTQEVVLSGDFRATSSEDCDADWAV